MRVLRGLRTVHLVALTLVLAALLTPFAWAGGGPAGYIVVYDPTDVRSVTIANAYQRARSIPERNMVPYVFSSWASLTDAYNFIYALRAELQARGLSDQLQGIAMAGYAPIGSTIPEFSMAAFVYLSPSYSQASFPVGSAPVPSFPLPAEFNGPSPAGTVAMTAATDFNGRHFWPVSWVGFPGPIGNNLPEILRFIERAKAADGRGNPNGAVYLPLTTDDRSKTRAPELFDVLPVWDARQIRYVTTLNPSASDTFPWVSDRPDVQGGEVGTYQPVTYGNSYGPGAWVDICTSVGGSMNSYIPPGSRAILNSRCSFWLREGADGTSGSVGEPFAIQGKFPNYNIHTHLRAGASLAEAYWQSIQIPAQVMPLGDPLLQPFAKFPAVTVSAPTNGATVAGTLAINATATPTGGQTLETNLDLFVDGRRISIGVGSEPVAATRTGSGFSLDTTTLADGWHDIRVVAYNNDAVRSQGEAAFALTVNNTGKSIALTGPATVNPDSTASFTVTPTGLGDLTGLILRANGRTLTNLAVGGGAVTLNLTNVTTLAPLTNDWTIFAVGTRGNGQQVWSAPFTTTVVWPATAATNLTPGPVMVDVRYFNSTTNSTFNWDTTPPSVVTNYNGDSFEGLTIRTNLPGITVTNLAAKPAYDMQLLIYAPSDDWYEIGMDYQGAGPTNRSVILDGVKLVEGGNKQFGPRRLAVGWHSLRLQYVLAPSLVPPWIRYYLRGGANQDFLWFDQAKCANYATGATPTINSVTPSAAPVTGTTVTLTASATSGDGSPLTYYWGLGGPMGTSGNMPVSFPTNGAVGVAATTVTFTQTGNYKLVLKVAGAAGSAVTNVDVSVQAATPTMTLTTGNITNALQGAPLELFAYSQDQFGWRVPITGTNTNLPTVQWSSTDPGATFINISADGEIAQYRSFSAVSNTVSFTITATGVNGRSGTATSPGLTLVTNAPPTATGDLFTFSQDATHRFLFTLTATVNDPESVANNGTYNAPAYPYQLSRYQWSVIATPPGQTLTLSGTNLNIITATASGAGTYQVQLTATDQTGASVTRTSTLLVAANGTALWTGFGTMDYMYNVLTVGETAYLSMQRPLGTETYQWQTSGDGGATWSNVTGTAILMGDALNPYYYGLSVEYGPVTLADNGRLFRLLTTNLAGTIASDTIALTVTSPVGGTIVAATTSSLVITEYVGNVTMILRRAGDFTGAASATYSWDNGSTSGSGSKSWAAGTGGDKTVSVPIPTNSIPNLPAWIYFSIDSVSNAVSGSPSTVSVEVLDDDTPAITFMTNALTVVETASNVVLTVRRQVSAVGAFNANYATVDGTAVAGQSYTATSGSLSWTNGDSSDRTLTVPLINDPTIRGAVQFDVRLTATNALWLGAISNATVTVQDAPYQQWQQYWWPAAVPTTTVYNAYATASVGASPLFLFRLGELTGTNVFAVDGTGAIVLTGIVSKVGTGGDFTNGVAGPRPPTWPGLESTNAALQFVGGSPNTIRYTAGAKVNGGIARGIGPRLNQGFTFSVFVNTSVTNRFMSLAGGVRTNAPTCNFMVGLNQAYANATSCVPNAVRLYIKSGTPVLEYSVVFQDLPTGSLCDGQWHHLAITQPAFTDLDNTDYARFYFDGTEANALYVRGAETVDSTTTLGDFDTTGFCLGNDGAIASTIRYFNGSLDEVAFIPRVLTPGEIAELATAHPPGALPGYMDDTATPAGDGIANLLKYAFGLDPLTATNRGGLAYTCDSNLFSIVFTRMRDAIDIRYGVVSTADLISNNWTEIWTSATNVYPSGAPSYQQIIPVNLAGLTNSFYRLRISRP